MMRGSVYKHQTTHKAFQVRFVGAGDGDCDSASLGILLDNVGELSVMDAELNEFNRKIYSKTAKLLSTNIYDAKM